MLVKLLPDIAVIGGTSTTGGWVIERALERGHELRVLTLASSVLSPFATKIGIVTGSCTKTAALEELLYDSSGNTLLAETLVCVTSEITVVDQLTMAESLSALFRSKKSKPRVVWLTEEANTHDVTHNTAASIYPVKTEKPCFELPLLMKIDLSCLFPLLQQPVSEDENIEDENIEAIVLEKLMCKAVVIRPSATLESVPFATFTEEWRIAGGDNPNYQLLGQEYAMDQHPAISHRALASAILDLLIDDSRDGTAVIAVHRQGNTHPIISESLEL